MSSQSRAEAPESEYVARAARVELASTAKMRALSPESLWSQKSPGVRRLAERRSSA
jgi:hypothetical protein